MNGLSGSGRSLLRGLVRRTTTVGNGSMVPKRGMADQTEYVSFNQWRSGEKTLMEFQNANREYIVLAYFTIAGVIYFGMKQRKKRKAKREAAAAAAAGESAAEGTVTAASTEAEK